MAIKHVCNMHILRLIAILCKAGGPAGTCMHGMPTPDTDYRVPLLVLMSRRASIDHATDMCVLRLGQSGRVDMLCSAGEPSSDMFRRYASHWLSCAPLGSR